MALAVWNSECEERSPMEQREFKLSRGMGLTEATFIGVGAMIGAGADEAAAGSESVTCPQIVHAPGVTRELDADLQSVVKAGPDPTGAAPEVRLGAQKPAPLRRHGCLTARADQSSRLVEGGTCVPLPETKTQDCETCIQ